jgi:3-oxo-4-pregnene-20-carboxyl-CoA dehydrogenase alpha subunit
MDFTLDETQQAVARVAAGVLGPARPAGPPAAADGFDSALWKELGRAGLLSLALPAWLGGDGLGVLDVAVALTEVGRRAASVPALATLVLGVLPVVRWGDRHLQQALLAGVAAGDTVLTAAVREPSGVMPARPATTATLRRTSGTVSGVKIGVPYAAAADWILVPASLDAGGTGVVVVQASAEGVSWQRTHSSSGEPEYTLRLDQAPVADLLGSAPGHGEEGADRAAEDLYQLAVAGACSLADGALAGALALTTAHVAAREQFGRPLAAFQAVAGQVADTYIASRTLHLATLSACWRLQAGRDARSDLDVAAYWLAGQAPAALLTCHHLHGGIGMDVTYPLHRYSSLVKDLVRFVGGADYRLDRLGARACEAAASGETVPPGRPAAASGQTVPPDRR